MGSKRGFKPFERGVKQTEIGMVRFLGRQFVVQAKSKIRGIMRVDIIGAIGTDVEGVRFLSVPETTIRQFANASDDTTFAEVKSQLGA